MSVTYTCDRCGKSTTTPSNDYMVELCFFGEVDSIRLRDRHLCKDCTEGLLDWLEKGADDESRDM